MMKFTTAQIDRIRNEVLSIGILNAHGTLIDLSKASVTLTNDESTVIISAKAELPDCDIRDIICWLCKGTGEVSVSVYTPSRYQRPREYQEYDLAAASCSIRTAIGNALAAA